MHVKICIGYFNRVHYLTRDFIHAFEGADIKVSLQQCQGVYIDDNRNYLINQGQSTKVKQKLPEVEKNITHYFFIDSDVSHGDPVGVLKKLLAHNKPIISGAYLARVNTNCYTAGYFNKCLGDIDSVTGMVNKETTGLLKVDWVGGGALLVKREVFEQLPYPWFGRECLKYIDEKTGEEHTAITGEDISFCMKAKEAGIDIWLDADAIFTHHLDRGSFGPMKLTIGDLERPLFTVSLTALTQLKTLKISDAWKLRGVLKAVAETISKINDLKQVIFDKYPALIFNPNGSIDESKLDVTTKNSYHKDVEEMFKQEFDIPLDAPIVLREDTVGLSAQDCANLEKIISI